MAGALMKTLFDRARAMQEQINQEVNMPLAAAILPKGVRGLLREIGALLVDMAAQIEIEQRKGGNDDKK